MGWFKRMRRVLASALVPANERPSLIAPWRCQMESARQRQQQLLRHPGVSKVDVGLVAGRIVLRVFDEHGTHLESVPMPKCLGHVGCTSEVLKV